jgi:hypothetical protein
MPPQPGAPMHITHQLPPGAVPVSAVLPGGLMPPGVQMLPAPGGGPHQPAAVMATGPGAWGQARWRGLA